MTERKKITDKDVSSLTASYLPEAECQHAECRWALTAYRFWPRQPEPREISLEAKRHAKQNPGHYVQVDRITRTVYLVPSEEGQE